MKKTTANNRRKKLPLLLGALLIISVAAYGTRAYFSESATVQSDIKLSLGYVDIKMDDSGWKYTPSKNVKDEAKYENKNLKLTGEDGKTITGNQISNNMAFSKGSIENVRLGDSFTRTFTITNTGSLDVKMYLESKLLSDNSPFVITIDGIDKGTTLSAGADPTDYDLTLTVDPDNVENVETNVDNIALDYIEDYLTIKAVQTNADEGVNE